LVVIPSLEVSTPPLREVSTLVLTFAKDAASTYIFTGYHICDEMHFFDCYLNDFYEKLKLYVPSAYYLAFSSTGAILLFLNDFNSICDTDLF
jgi:hypothetical protein